MCGLQTTKKGKEGTKGSKQIVEENRTTLAFYRNMFLGGLTAQLTATFALFSTVSPWDYVRPPPPIPLIINLFSINVIINVILLVLHSFRDSDQHGLLPVHGLHVETKYLGDRGHFG